ncbi:MAG: MFS transporter [Coriobacteriales bacterium]|jgi:DHA1 family inner membrane transport protein
MGKLQETTGEAGHAEMAAAGSGEVPGGRGRSMSGEPAAPGVPAADGAVVAHPHATLSTALLVALAFVLGCAEFMIIGVEPDVAAGLGASLSSVGNLVGYFAVTYAVCTPVLAMCTGRFRRWPLLAAYLAILNVGCLLAAVSASYAMLLVARVVTASVSGAAIAVATTFVPELVDQRRVPLVISFVFSGYSVASVLGVPAGTVVSAAFGWRAAFAVVLVVSLVVSALALALLPRTGATDAPSTVRDQLELLRDPRVISCVALFVFGAGSTYVFYTYVTPVLQTLIGLTSAASSAVLVAYGVATLASNLLSGWVAQRFGVRALVVVYLLQAMLLAVLGAACASVAGGVADVLAIGVLMYLLNSPGQLLFMRVAQRDYPNALTMATSLEPTAFNVGIAFGSLVGGIVVSSAGLACVGPVGAAVSVVAAGVAALTARLSSRGRRRAQA